MLTVADSPRLAGESLDHARALADADDPLPPILVRAENYQVIDGMHRLIAARMRGMETIPAQLVEADATDAFVLAVQSNIAHGLPLTTADRKSAARRIVASHPSWSDRMVASVTGLAANTVKTIRAAPDTAEGRSDARLGRDGRVRPIDASERRAKAAQILNEHPEYSLRVVAKMAGLSPETVRSVKARMASDPELSGQDLGSIEPGTETVGPADLKPADLRRSIRILIADPALRSHDLGRAFLRSFGSYAVVYEHSEAIINLIPEYDLELVCGVARAMADAWVQLEKAVRRRSQAAKNRQNGHVVDSRSFRVEP